MKKKDEMLFGFHSIIEAIKSNKTFEKIFIKKGLQGDLFQECFKLIRDADIPFQYVPIQKLNRITRASHQGIIALTSSIEYHDISIVLPGIYEAGKDPLILVLDGITDIRNFGAIARSAEAAGVDAIVIARKGAAIINADAIKTSAGALNRIPVCRVESIGDTLKFLTDSGIVTIGASEKAENKYHDINMDTPLAVVMGAEDKGLSYESLKYVEQLIKIPMIGKVSSLNVSVATGIILFEAVRQRLSSI